MKTVVIASLLGMFALTSIASAQECEQGQGYGDCSRNNEGYRHGRWRSRTEPYYRLRQHYEFHQRAASRRQGYHERADSVRGRR